MDLATSTKEYGGSDRSWLGLAHGVDSGRNITLDGALFYDAGVAVAMMDGERLPSGVVLGMVTATEKYGPYDDTAVDGRAVAAGHLLSDVKVKDGATVGASLFGDVGGRVIEAKLPADHGLDAAAKADLSRIVYV